MSDKNLLTCLFSVRNQCPDGNMGVVMTNRQNFTTKIRIVKINFELIVKNKQVIYLE